MCNKDIETKINALGIELIILEGQLIEKKSMEVKKKEKIIKELIKRAISTVFN